MTTAFAQRLKPAAKGTIFASSATLGAIPVLAVRPDFGLATTEAAPLIAHALMDEATRNVPRRALLAADNLSRAWLARSHNPHLPEIDAIAALLGRPGVHFLNVNYEWACTVGLKSSSSGAPQLVRVLDWRTPGLGRHVLAARMDARRGRFVSLTWPGFVGVLQALAPGRFAAAINQAPLSAAGGGLWALDWAVARAKVWRTRALPPLHLLRTCFEEDATFADAKRRLLETPIAAPAIFSLCGIHPGEMAIIERTEGEARLAEGPRTAANHWQTPLWRARSRGVEGYERVRKMAAHSGDPFADETWLVPPILNAKTRLVMVAEPRSGTLMAQGYEGGHRATAKLRMVA